MQISLTLYKLLASKEVLIFVLDLLWELVSQKPFSYIQKQTDQPTTLGLRLVEDFEGDTF